METEGVAGGKPRIGGTRIQVADVVQYYTELGWTIEKIAQELGIEPEEVLSALQYYYRHPQEIRAVLRERKESGPQPETVGA
ncbi:MAG: DUF433 domain-containing protein [Candidatus Nanohaloarchaea archaeon]|nr:DUF433 domain-containing protein [Candidatus Nanohaloarchaea archaeon]